MLIFPSFFNAGPATYEIEQSLRFDGSSYLSRTPSSAGNQRTYTYSFWTKGLPGGKDYGFLVVRQAVTPYFSINTNQSTDVLDFQSNNFGGNFAAVYRDPSSWYHFVLKVDTTQATQSERVVCYVNGVRQPNHQDPGNVTQNQDTLVNSTTKHSIGADDSYSYSWMEAYMAEVHLVDGTALDPTDFGEYDDNGVWRPKRYTGSYGTNGFYLKFDPTATNGIGHDHSGNGNNFTPSGFTTSGTGTDVMSDTPTTNYCTLNPIGTTTGFTTPTNGNLETDSGVSEASTEGTFAIPKDGNLYYFEGELIYDIGDGGGNCWLGTKTQGYTGGLYGGAKTFGFYGTDGGAYDGVRLFYSYGGYYAGNAGLYGHVNSGTVFGFAIKYDSGTWKYYVREGSNGWNYHNGSSFVYNTSFDETEPTATSTGIPENESLVPFANNFIVNFGQRDFAYTPPTGAKYLRSSDLPAPTIKDGSDYFNTVLYTGNGGTNAITGVGFQPDLVWIKNRTNDNNNMLFDAIRGTDNALSSNLPSAEYASVDGTLSAFGSDGFTAYWDGSAGTGGNTNQSSNNYVAWNWKEGADQGFDIVTYTGNGYPTTNSQSIAHNLGVKPAFIAIKNRDRSSQWLHYVGPLGATKGMEGWHDADTAYTNANYFNNTEPTSTHFTVGYDSGGNWQGDNFVAYLWAEVDGFFKVGTYDRNGSTDGPYIHLGFAPALVIIKEYAVGTEGWSMIDSKRPGYNPNDNPVLTNSDKSESYMVSTYVNDVDLLSNGFKIRNSDSRYNSTISTYKYLYFAWAKNPFGGSGVSPATAR